MYSGRDAQAGINVNAIILEIPLAFITESPEEDRIVNLWSESWVLKAAPKIESIPDHPLWLEHTWALVGGLTGDDELNKYKLVDTVGQAFADAGLNERADNRQVGGNNFWLAPHFVATRSPRLGVRFRRSAPLVWRAPSTTTTRRSRCTKDVFQPRHRVSSVARNSSSRL